MNRLLKRGLWIFISFTLWSCNETETRQQLLSDVANQASCVFMTKDPNGMPVVSWVEQNSKAVPKMFFATWNKKSGKFEHKMPIPIAFTRKGCRRLLSKRAEL